MSGNRNLIPRTNREFLGYIDRKTEHIYMISEFIDNSIQSCIDWKKESVKIKIVINMKEKAIYIIDNAAGIPYKDRIIAIKNGKDEIEQGNSLNMFGVGMKMASIWFGKRFSIFTKHIHDDFSYKISLDVDDLKDDNFYFLDEKIDSISNESGISFQYESGTIIKIDKLHLNSVHFDRYNVKFFKKGTKSEGKSLEDQLACRYERFLKKGLLVISFSYIDELGNEEMTPENVPIDITENKIPNLFIGNYSDRNDYEYATDKNIKNTKDYKEQIVKLENEYATIMDNETSFEGLTYRMIFDKFKNQEELKFNCSFTLKIKSKEKIPFSFGFIGKSKNDVFLKYSGLSVYQDDRAIISGPNSKNLNLTWLSFEKSFSNESYRVNRRFIGTIDLENKEAFRVDNNKQGFHGNIKDEIENIIIEKFKESKLNILFDKLLNFVFAKSDAEKEKKEMQKDILRFSDQINKNNVLDNCIVKTDDLTMINKDGDEVETTCIKVFDIQKQENMFNFVYLIESFENESKQIFKSKVQNFDNETLFVLLVNRSFFGFKPGIKDEAFSVLMNPIMNLILFSLKDCNTVKERTNKFNDLISGLEYE